jgi:hypothetical protein
MSEDSPLSLGQTKLENHRMKTNVLTQLSRKFAWITAAAFSLVCGQAQTPIQVPGFLKFEAYSGITGTPVQNLLDATKYPNAPDEVLYLTSFDTRTVYPNDGHENYGGRITGFITPIQSGDYEFFLRSDDASQLFLSTDDTAAKLQPIAEETGCCGVFEETGALETSAPIALVAGRRYYVQVLFKEGTGGDFCQVAWRRAGDTTPASALKPIPSALLSTMIPARGSVVVTKQPANATAPRNGAVSFSAEALPSHGPMVIQWQKNGTNVPNATGGTYLIDPVATADNGAKIRAVVSIPGAVTNSLEATLTVTADTTAPTIKNVLGSETFTTLTVDFSEAVTQASAGAAANYTLDGGLSVTSATVLSPTRVRLVTSKQTIGANYTLTVRNIIDTAGLTSATDTKKSFAAFNYVRGGLKLEAYHAIPGSAVDGLTGDPKYPDSPDFVGYVTDFTSRLVFPDTDSGATTRENYGGRMSGWIVPSATAQYEFFIRSDDGSRLFLSTDENPDNAVQIAEETGCCGPFEDPGAVETSLPIALTAGKRYFIMALWKEGGGGDYCDVAWRRVGDTTVSRSLPYISGAVLEILAAPGTFTPPDAAIVSPAGGSVFDPGALVTLSATASAAVGKAVTKVEFFDGAKKLGEATASPYAISLFDLSQDVHQITARVTDSAGLYKDSAPVTVTVGGQVEKVTLVAIDDKSTWRYDRTGRDLGTAWKEKVFDDSSWPQGKALIADEGTTTVEPIRTAISRFNDAGDYVRTFYFRTKFNFAGSSTSGAKLQLRHVVDDGAVIYLNGVEIHRFGIAAGAVNYLTDATGHENVYEGPYDIAVTNLVSGENVLAAEVHQSGGSSSDMVFGLELVATVPVVATVTPLVAIDDKTSWRYDRTGRDLGAAWKEKAFNDSAWPQGKALIADEGTTTVEPIRTAISRFNDAGDYVRTFYFRTHFNFSAASTTGTKLKMRHVVDDGVVVYLNGTEIHRFGIAAGAVDFLTDATGHENVYEGPYDIPITSLVSGDNVLAAEVHQSGGSSSDMVFGLELIATIPGGQTPPSTAPKLSVTSRTASNFTVEWSGAGTLQSANAVTGPWTDVANARSPFAALISAGARFYRLRQ